MPSYTIEESLNLWIKAQAGVTALVGTRIYPDLAPDTAAMPYVVVRIEDDAEEQTFATPSANPRRMMLVYRCVADRNNEGTKTARQVAEAIRSAFLNYSGTLYSGGKTVMGVTEIGITTGEDYGTGFDDQRIYRDVRIVLLYY